MLDDAVTPEPVEATTAKVSPGPPSARWTSKPVSFVELSCQTTSIRLSDNGVAETFEGAAGAGGASVVAQATAEESE